MDKDDLSKQLNQKMLDYIDALEKANEQLVYALKKCVELLAYIQPAISDQKGWQSILEDIEEIIKVGERMVEQRPIH